MKGTSILSVTGAGKRYVSRKGLLGSRVEHLAFGPVDLELNAGECVAVAGRSGAGKSTLARCLAGLEALSEGSLWADGVEHPGGPVPGVQLVFQDSPAAMNPAWSVDQIIREPLWLSGERKPEGRIKELLEQVGLPDGLLGRRADQLSGGQRRRVLIARALGCAGLRVLLLDEPFAGLDDGSAEAIAGLVSRLRVEKGLALLLITHDLGSVARLAGRLVVMSQGRFVEQLEGNGLFAGARHEESRALIGAMLPGAVG
ncbi:MAG: ATP-binding cassette domain-containing protein [Bryobacterales bacterium]|nr:ATP-binding cassette domain-containing protein [Bryobacterales bacterium]